MQKYLNVNPTSIANDVFQWQVCSNLSFQRLMCRSEGNKLKKTTHCCVINKVFSRRTTYGLGKSSLAGGNAAPTGSLDPQLCD